MHLFRSLQVFQPKFATILYLFHAPYLRNNGLQNSLLNTSLNKANVIRSHAEPDRYEIHVSRLYLLFISGSGVLLITVILRSKFIQCTIEFDV